MIKDISKYKITKEDAARLLFYINRFTGSSLPESYLWQSDIDNTVFSDKEIEMEWNHFLDFVDKYYNEVFRTLVDGEYITTSNPIRGFDTSVMAYFNALNGEAHWAPAGKTPRKDLPRISHTERDQYEIVACYIAGHPAIASELINFHEAMSVQTNNNYINFLTDDIDKQFDVFWSQPVSFDASLNAGCSVN